MWGVWGRGWKVCKHCVRAGRDEKRRRTEAKADSMSARTHTCEGCYAVAETQGRMMPDDWTGYGTSRFPKQPIAEWCPICTSNGTMERDAQSTKARAQAFHERKTARGEAAPLPVPPDKPASREAGTVPAPSEKEKA